MVRPGDESTAQRAGPRPPESKILDRDTLVRRHARPRAHTLVFTNGCFDLLHRGHTEYLAAARDLGDLLVVALNTDDSVRRLKGRGRPVTGEDDRARTLAALECVDIVTLFDQDTPLELITALAPDVLVKGGDYDEETVVGADAVRAAGGRVAIIPLVEGRSTSGLLRRIREET